MGHDISGYNKAGEEIAYARFSMGNYNFRILYGLLGADEFNAGVSGSGGHSVFSLQQIEQALNDCHLFFKNEALQSEGFSWDKKQIFDFLLNCLSIVKKEGSVSVYFG
ncbi:hypothetical protein GJU41_22635 [Bacillus idriensis]|uniref:Uncharacterized protein n=1 Tax=Metabacillus idriensis TaxID=324768 RepID=A0A6I2MH97_9BACI|nr:hypothetical protein [Metabacillus idriensis]MRX56744.1 hypothetical protein [Metabacillus idriensis]